MAQYQIACGACPLSYLEAVTCIGTSPKACLPFAGCHLHRSGLGGMYKSTLNLKQVGEVKALPEPASWHMLAVQVFPNEHDYAGARAF